MFVPGALPGETVVVRVVEDRRSWARAALVDVVTPSADRVEPVATPDVLGGGDLAHVAPEGQRRLKTRVLREQLTRLGRVTDPPVADCRSVGPDLGYRTNVRLHAAPDGRLGFHRASSHDVVPVEQVLLGTPEVQALREAVGDRTGAAEVSLRAHATTGSAAVTITPGPGPLDLPDGDFDVVLAQPSGKPLAVRGDGILAERVAGLTYRFDTTVLLPGLDGRRRGARRRGAARRRRRRRRARVGPLRRRRAAVAAARPGGCRGGRGRGPPTGDGVGPAQRRRRRPPVRVEQAPVEDLVRAVAGRDRTDLDPPEVVVLDPPRTGAGEAVIGDLVGLGPAAIVYVACDVAALGA